MSDDPRPTRGTATEEHGAFLAIGVVFVVLGLSSFSSGGSNALTAFLPVGIVFVLLSLTRARRAGERADGQDADAAPDSHPDDRA